MLCFFLETLGNQGHNNNNNVDVASDDEFSNDGASVYSYQSDNAAPEVDAETADASVVEKFEEKLMQAIENASEKSQQTRLQSLQVINDILKHHSMYDFVDDRRATIMDIVEKSLKKGKGQEQALAAKMGALLMIQLQGDEDIFKTLTPLLQQIALDNTASADSRASCCSAIAVLHFLGSDSAVEAMAMCHLLEGIFSASYLKGDNSASAVTNDAATLHAAALTAWGLLLTLIPTTDIASLLETKQILSSFKNLMSLLKSQHLDVRMTAGEVIALLMECGRTQNELFLEEYIDELLEIAKTLATDSSKYKAKRERKQQRATFRDVLHYFEDENVAPNTAIQVGSGVTKQQLILDSWVAHHQYGSIVDVLGSGTGIHLQGNDYLRDCFEMGPTIDATQATLHKLSKNEKRAIQSASYKARTISRGKNRDKRSAVMN